MAIRFLSSENVEGHIDVNYSQNGITYLAVTNTNSGVAANARIQAVGESSQLDIIASSAGYTGVTGWADSGIISTDSGASGGLKLNSQAGGLSFQIGTSTAMFVDTTSKVGINTITPPAVLTVKDNQDSVMNAGFAVERSNNTTRGYFNMYGGALNIVAYDNTPIKFRVGASGVTTAQTILSNGNIGIGTTGPATKLDIHAGSITLDSDWPIYFGANALIEGNASGTNLRFNATAGFKWTDGGTTNMVLLDSGDVGIGTATPDEKLHITDSDGANIILNTDATANNSGIYMSEGADATPTQNGAYIYYDAADNDFRIATGGASLIDRLTIARDTGNVGIGTDDPQTNLEISDTDAAGLTIRSVSLTGYSLINFADAGDDNVGRIYYGHDDNAMRFRTNDAERMRIDDGGDVGIGVIAPVSKLHIDKATQTIGTTVPSGAILVGDTGGGDMILELGYDRASISYIQSRHISSNTAYNLAINPEGGNVGIGTITPAQKLDVAGKIVSSIDLTVGNNSSGAVRYSGQNGYYSFITRSNYNDWSLSLLGTDGDASADPIGTQLMTVNYTGKVGIGTTAPDTLLHLSTTDGTSIIRLERNDTTITSGDSYGQLQWEGQDNNTSANGVRASIEVKGYGAGTQGEVAMYFRTSYVGATSNQDRMIINHLGALQLNAYGSGTFTGTATYKLSVDSSGNVIETAIGAGAVDGSGTANTITMWTDSDTIGNSIITESGDVINISAGTPELKLTDTSSSATFKVVLNGVNTDITNSGTDGDVAFHTHNGEKFRMTEDFSYFSNCNVGIGTATPANLLDVGGGLVVDPAIRIDSASGGSPSLIFDASQDNRTAHIKFYDNGSSVGGFIDYLHNGDKMNFGSGSSTNVTMTVGDTKVGIGTDDPSVRLHIQTETAPSDIYLTDGTVGTDNYGGVIRGFSTTGQGGRLQLGTLDNDIYYPALTILEQGGNVGIGTDSPTVLVHALDSGTKISLLSGTVIGAQASTTTATNCFYSAIAGNAGISALVLGDTDDNDQARVQFNNSGRLLQMLNAGAGITIDSSGDVGIGTTTPDYRLDVESATDSLAGAYIQAGHSDQGEIQNTGLIVGSRTEISTGDYLGISFSGNDTTPARGRAAIGVVSTNGKDGMDLVFMTKNAADGTQLLTADTKMTITDGGDVGIGTDSPAKKLDVQVAGGDGIRVSNSTNAAYYSDLLINYNDVSSMQLTCMGTSILQAGNTGNTVLASRTNKDIILSPSGTGNVGIGTTAPATFLQIGDYPSNNIDHSTYPDVPSEHLLHLTAPETTNYYGGGISFGENAFTAANITVQDAGGGGALNMLFGTRHTSGIVEERMRIQSDGYVNIKQKQNSGLAYDILINIGTSPDGKIGYQTLDQLAVNLGTSTSSLWTASGNDIYNTNSDNVGIGTTSPSKKLTVDVGSTSGDGIQLYGSSSPGVFINETSGTVNSHFQNDGAASYLGTSTSHPMIFRTANAERMRLTGTNMTGGWDETARLYGDYPVLTFNSTAASKMAGIGYDSSFGMRFWVNAASTDVTAGTDVLSISNAGLVNIGTTSAFNEKLTVASANGTAYTSVPQIRVSSTTGNNRAAILFTDSALSDGKISYYPHATAQYRYFSISARLTESDFVILGNGKVGIGTTAPDALLDIEAGNDSSADAILWGEVITNAGNSALSGYGAGLQFKNSSVGEPYKWAGIAGVAGSGYSNTTDLVLYASINSTHDAVERMRVTGAGNVGIGTATPGGKLDVNGPVVISPNTAGKDTFTLSTNASNDARLLMKSDTTTKVDIQANGDTYFNGGDVGIGTTSPQSKLQVAHQGNSNGGSILMGIGGSGTNKYSVLCGAHYNQGTGSGSGSGSAGIMMIGTYGSNGENDVIIGGNVWESNAATTIKFYTHTTDLSTTGGTERMRITSAGNVGIGTTTPYTPLEVSAADSIIRLNVSGGVADKSNYEIRAIGASGFEGMQFRTVNDANTVYSSLMMLEYGGNVGIGTDSPDSVLNTEGSGDERVTIDSMNGSGTSGVHFRVYTLNGTPAMTAVGTVATQSNGDMKFYTGTTSEVLAMTLQVAPQTADFPARVQVGTALNVGTNLVVTGSISKGSGSFRIDHPLEDKKDTHDLVHSFIEGPQADLIYRGKVDLVSGAATINIDTAATMTEGTFVVLNTNVQCFTSNETDWDAVKGSVSGNTLIIACENASSTATVSWMVIGERQDEHMKDTDWTDDDGKVIVEPEKET